MSFLTHQLCKHKTQHEKTIKLIWSDQIQDIYFDTYFVDGANISVQKRRRFYSAYRRIVWNGLKNVHITTTWYPNILKGGERERRRKVVWSKKIYRYDSPSVNYISNGQDLNVDIFCCVIYDLNKDIW